MDAKGCIEPTMVIVHDEDIERVKRLGYLY